MAGSSDAATPGRLARALASVHALVPVGHPWWSYWPALLGPLTVGAVALGWWSGADPEIQKGPNEVAAVILTGFATVCWGVEALRQRDPLAALCTFLSLAFLQREIHFTGSDEILDAMGLVLLVWGWLWRERLAAPLARGQRWPWLVATGWTYLFSQLVARRVFRGVPFEEELHVWVEEAVENTAHVMLIVSAFSHRLPGRARPRSG